MNKWNEKKWDDQRIEYKKIGIVNSIHSSTFWKWNKRDKFEIFFSFFPIQKWNMWVCFNFLFMITDQFFMESQGMMHSVEIYPTKRHSSCSQVIGSSRTTNTVGTIKPKHKIPNHVTFA